MLEECTLCRPFHRAALLAVARFVGLEVAMQVVKPPEAADQAFEDVDATIDLNHVACQ